MTAFTAAVLTFCAGFLLWDFSLRRWRERREPFREWHRGDTILTLLFLGYAAIAGWIFWDAVVHWWRLQ